MNFFGDSRELECLPYRCLRPSYILVPVYMFIYMLISFDFFYNDYFDYLIALNTIRYLKEEN